MEVSQNKTISVFDYNDFRIFLRDWFDWQKAKNGMTFAKFAEVSGFQSKSHIHLIMSNKRALTGEGIDKTLKGLGLSDIEAQGFILLVKYGQTRNIQDRLLFWDAFVALKPQKKSYKTVTDLDTYLQNFFIPVMLQILRQKNLHLGVNELSQLLGVSKEVVDSGLNVLGKLGLIKFLPNEDIEVLPELLTTNEGGSNQSLLDFHKSGLQKSIEALSLKSEEREFQSLLLALPKQGLQHLKTKLRQFADEIDQMYGGPQPDAEKIYYCSLNIVPVSNSLPSVNNPTHEALNKAG
ncbi:MAG: TIGR02147 family protein [Pseudobdellovibrionaceae bacterium]